MKKDAYYFFHDANARNDIRIMKLRMELGMEGLGIFWCLIEILRESQRYKLKISEIRQISYSLNVSEEIVLKVVSEFDLFKTKDGEFYSQRLCKSMSKWDKTKQSLSESGKRGNAIRWGSGGDRKVIAIREEKKREEEEEKIEWQYLPDGTKRKKPEFVR